MIDQRRKKIAEWRADRARRSGTFRQGALSWRVQLALAGVVLLAVVTVGMTNNALTQRFTETTRNRGELRLVLYSGNVVSELRRSAIVPQLLSRDPTLISALGSNDFQQTSMRLISFVDEIGAASLMMLDREGRTVAATERNRLGENHRSEAFFIDALRSNATVFTVMRNEVGDYSFTYSRRMDSKGDSLGVIVVEVDLAKFERAWTGISDALILTDSEGTIILSTEPRWRGLKVDEALADEAAESVLARAFEATSDWNFVAADTYLDGEAMMRVEQRMPFRGWTMTSFSTYASVRERVNGVLALEIMGFALFLALAFYFLSRKTALRMAFFQKESSELRSLNARLQIEISERERVQKDLHVAEQSLAQSSKLAALGEMSAAVSHELNQPLAAMKTYLAGARLLLNRNRPEEALSAFHRIDDLIERMGAITRQLKSYARKGQSVLSEVDLADALASSLSMMEPQLRSRRVEISRILPDTPVRVLGDRMRIEQVLVNLLRNALDATKSVKDPLIEVILASGETATMSVRDNGLGIEDLDSLFEPFYTTKQPGDGVGLGLAISSGIVSDLGGRLTARNSERGGAVFEMQLPILNEGRDENTMLIAE